MKNSKEDLSNSIQNQKAILLQYARDHHFPHPTFFIDDGYSGVDFANRPGFQKMLAGIEAGNVGTVITKDLSRLGRNSSLTGLYINYTFPQNDVRYIAVNDHFDTIDPNSTDNDISGIKNWFNEFFAKDTSRKILAVGAKAPLSIFLNEKSLSVLLSISKPTPIPFGIRSKGRIPKKIKRFSTTPILRLSSRKSLTRCRKSDSSDTEELQRARAVRFRVWYSVLIADTSSTTPPLNILKNARTFHLLHTPSQQGQMQRTLYSCHRFGGCGLEALERSYLFREPIRSAF